MRGAPAPVEAGSGTTFETRGRAGGPGTQDHQKNAPSTAAARTHILGFLPIPGYAARACVRVTSAGIGG